MERDGDDQIRFLRGVVREEAAVEELAEDGREPRLAAVFEPVDELPDRSAEKGRGAREVEGRAFVVAVLADGRGRAERGVAVDERLAADRAAALRGADLDKRAAVRAERVAARRPARGASLRVEQAEPVGERKQIQC